MSVEVLQASSIAGNTDTTFTSGNTTQRKILYGHIIFTADATATNRTVKIQVLDGSNALIADYHAGAVVGASAANQHHSIMQGVYRETAFVNNSLQVPIPKDCILKAGWKINITIDNGQAGDSYSVNLVVSDEHLGARA